MRQNCPYRPGARDRDDELSRALQLRLEQAIELSLDPRGPRSITINLPADIHKQAEFCSMCGPKHCPMQTKITDEDLSIGKLSWLKNSTFNFDV